MVFTVINIYCVKPSDEDAVIALHEDWQRHLRAKAQGYLSGELLSSSQSERCVIAIARYESEEVYRLIVADPEQAAWYRRLLSLFEEEVKTFECIGAWAAELASPESNNLPAIPFPPLAIAQ